MNSSTNPTPFPETRRLELPILQELQATGGGDQPRYLCERLVRYFPQLVFHDGHVGQVGHLDEGGDRDERARFLRLVQRAAKRLSAQGELHRQRTRWQLTDKGRRRLLLETLRPEGPAPESAPAGHRLGHGEVQRMLVEIGQMLGRHAEAEFEHYDVVWRDGPAAPRLSHVFEVQIAGSVDSALTRLKRAHDAQRSRLFLVVADERSARFADQRLGGCFHEIGAQLTVVGVGELARLYQSLLAERALLTRLSARG